MHGARRISIIAIAILCCIILLPSFTNVHPNLSQSVESLSVPLEEKFTMLFASDVHMGFPYIDDLSSKDFGKFIADINSSIHPDSLVLVGDLTDTSLNYQWDSLQKALGNISDSVLRDDNTHLAIGNHDINGSISITANHDAFKQRFGYLPNYTFEIGNTLFIVLATQCYEVYGYLAPSQINWLNSTISANVDKNIIIVSHHPLQNTTWSTSSQMAGYENGVDKQLHSMMRWQNANVSMWIHGHRHDPMYHQNQSNVVDGITYINIASVEFQTFPYLEVSWLAEFTQGSKNVSFKPRVSNAAIPYYNDNMTRNVSLKYPFSLEPVPTGSITINSGALYTYDPSATLTLTASANVSEMRFSSDRATWSPWQPYSVSKSWIFLSGDGTKSVYLQLKNSAGFSSKVYVASIVLDTEPPTGSIMIDSGAIFTNTTSVTLTLSAFDSGSGLDRMRFSYSSGDFAWESWKSYATSTDWILSVGDGLRTLYAQFIDNMGRLSIVYNDSIILDTIPPILTIIEGNNSIFKSSSVTINWNASDATSGLSSIWVSFDSNASFALISNASRSISWNDLEDGDHYVIIRAMDEAGNVIEKRLDFKVSSEASGNSNGNSDWLSLTIIILAIAAVTAPLALRLMRRKRPRSNQPPKSSLNNRGKFR